MIAALVSSAALAQNPYDRRVADLERQAMSRSRRNPTGAILAVNDIMGYRDQASPGRVLQALDRIADNRRLIPAVRAQAATSAAISAGRHSGPTRAAERVSQLGFVTSWRIVGPFDNEGKSGFDQAFPPEAEQATDAAPLGASYPGRDHDVQWRVTPDGIAPDGYISFDELMAPRINVCGYAETFFRRDDAELLTLWVGTGGAKKVWFNGREVMRDETVRGVSLDQSVATVAARRGWNRVLIKACITDREWGFYFRVGDRGGNPIANLAVDPQGARRASAASGEENVPDGGPQSILQILESAAGDTSEDNADATAIYNLARYLRWTGAEEPEENRSRQLAARAAELEPSAEHLVFAAELAESRADRMRFIQQAHEAFPRDLRVRFARADLIASGPDSGRVLRMLDLPRNTPEGLDAAWYLASLYEERNLKEAALAIVEEGVRITRGSLAWRSRQQRMLAALGRHQAAEALFAELVEATPGDRRRLQNRIELAMERGETEHAIAWLDRLRAVAPIGTLRYSAAVLEGLGRQDESLALFRQLIDICPDEADYHVEYGHALLRAQQEQPAREAFRAALALRPQDPETRQLLERLEPSAPRPDERFAIPAEEFLARREDSSDWPATVLQDLTVSTVFETGLSSTFRQYVYQVHTEEGARQMASHPVVFEPGAQWVDIRRARVHKPDGSVVETPMIGARNLASGAYRVYYNTRAQVISFPNLEPGDTVELVYRVEDISRQNAFGDYFGDIHVLQGRVPTTRLEHIFMVPESRTLRFNDPRLPGLEHTASSADGQTQHRFVATQIPPILNEPNMPGFTNVAAYLHVSTYASWEDLGRWWWGLASPQLTLDDELRAQAEELVDGASTTREKVRAIYEWVTTNTRYVGLEFGIHGFKPYRVTQIAQRGFGDCKDTASLIYAMLTHVGVDARIALVRTRHLGTIESEPASLAAFNHAIAYVPELDLFLDGTTDTSGMDELPGGDQGAMTLVVGPDDATLRTIPEHEAEQQRFARNVRANVNADGSATLEGEVIITGPPASPLRSRFSAEGQREERLEDNLQRLYPGLDLTEQSFGDLEDFSVPVRYTFAGTAPQFAETGGSTLRIAPSANSGLTRRWAPTPTRRYALDLGGRFAFDESLEVQTPSGGSVSQVPNGGRAESPFGRVVVTYERTNRGVRVQTEIRFLRSRVSPEEYPAFRQWLEAADTLLRERVVLEGGAQ